MGHSVQLIIGREPAVGRFLKAWPAARGVALQGEWVAIPVDEALCDAIGAGAAGAERDAAFDSSPPGLEAALAAATAQGGALAYVETEYFGGQGSQSAGAWVDGAARGAERGIGAINTALRAIGVVAADGMDAFDTIGLGRRRRMEDYAAPAPVAAPRPALPRFAPRGTDHVPLWVIALVFFGVIAAGLLVAWY